MITKSKQKGFTLIEMLLYVAVVAIMLVTLLSFSLQMLDSGAKSQTDQTVYSEARYAAQRLTYEIRNAGGVNVASSSFGVNLAASSSAMFSLVEASSTLSPTIIDVTSGGTLTIQQGAAAPVALTSSSTRVTSLTFSNYSTSTFYNIGFVMSVASAASVGTAGSPSYTYEVPLTVTSNTSIASGTQSSFPMLVSSTLSSFAAVSYGGHVQNVVIAPNGGQEPADLIYSQSSSCSSPLSFETESYNSSTGALADWVNVPTMAAGQVIYACYGNSAVNTDQSNPGLTWNNNYVGVYHFPNGTTLSGADSAGTSDDLSFINLPGATAGMFDGGMQISHSTGNYASSTSNNFHIGGSWTISTWAKPSTVPGSSGAYELVQRLDASSNINYLIALTKGAFGDSGTPGFMIAYDGTVTDSQFAKQSTSVTAGNWYHVVGVWDSVAQTLTLYVNGAFAATTNESGNPPVNGTGGYLGIGGDSTGNWGWDGKIDESRVSSVALSSSWIATEYNNQLSPSTFYAIGSETSGGGGSSGSPASGRNEYIASTTIEGSAELRSE